MGIWSIVTLLAHNFGYLLHGWLVIVPLWFFLGSTMDYLFRAYLRQSSMHKMELLDNGNVKLWHIQGKEIVCKIEDLKFLGRIRARSSSELGSKKKMKATAVQCKDLQGKTHPVNIFWMNLSKTQIENKELFHWIINGNTKEVEKFVYDPTTKETKDKDKKEEHDIDSD